MDKKKKMYLLTTFLSILIIISWLITLKYSLSFNSSSTNDNLNLKQNWQNVSKIIQEFKNLKHPSSLNQYNPQSTNFHLQPGQLEDMLKNIDITVQTSSTSPTSSTQSIIPLTNDRN